MAKRKTEEYIFADAFIGCYVRNLMNRQDMLRLASCRDLAAAEAVLQEFGYGEARELYDGDIEWFIRREQNKLFNLIYDTLPERKELALCLFPYDYHNVKVCLKSEFLGIVPSEDYLVSTGDIDWKRLARAEHTGSGIHFVFMKATEGSDWADSAFQYNFAQARANGFIRGAYHFFSNTSPAEEQAKFFCSRVQLDANDLPPVLDVETRGNYGLDSLQLEVKTWLRHVERHYGERVPSERRQRPVDGCRAREIPDVEQDDDCGRRPAVEQKAVAGQVGA